ncbi:MAG: sigma-70 family RNA polymerase sigma factor [Candidatus Cellulosilyticum pullistercoris]|uniref:Sigma-70 family RNA polymerase sigma factor n=1 Tax=Candidatus Cellulosilyticum pullistercoris TaxID=2838521 RepID=A0A9E2NKP6_9FIRM|nr:sigma-70 family RNA polymerase sigma factor [Candidatus Cellulosilyticum pullistercoris]
MEDKALIHFMKENPEGGLNQVMSLYAPFVKAIIVKYLGCEKKEDIKECIADVFIKLWRFIGNFDESKGSLKSYIAVIARNEALRKLKKEGKYLSDLNIDELEIGIEVDMVSEMGRKINAKLVQEAIEALKEPDRQIFIKRYFWGQRIKEISKELRLEEKFIENRLYLVKKQLKGKLLEKGVIL